MISKSPAFTPAIITGITIHPKNSLQFDFIIDTGDDNLQGENFTVIVTIGGNYGQNTQRTALANPDISTSETLTPGGIDFNPDILDLDVSGNAQGIHFSLPEQSIQNIRINGFVPIIINITPVSDFSLLLGLAENDTVNQLSLIP